MAPEQTSDTQVDRLSLTQFEHRSASPMPRKVPQDTAPTDPFTGVNAA